MLVVWIFHTCTEGTARGSTVHGVVVHVNCGIILSERGERRRMTNGHIQPRVNSYRPMQTLTISLAALRGHHGAQQTSAIELTHQIDRILSFQFARTENASTLPTSA